MHRFPWRIHPTAKNGNVIKQLKKQIKKKIAPPELKLIPKVLQKWKRKGDQDDWVQGQQSQAQLQLWAHDNVLTNYQVWVAYRMAVVQLNMYYEGWTQDESCPLDATCQSTGRDVAHVVWTCHRAQLWWKHLLEHWLGHEVKPADIQGFKDYFSARTASPIGDRLRKRIRTRIEQWKNEIDSQLRRIWWAWCSIGAALLWQVRNQVVHEGVKRTPKSQVEFMWKRGLQQLYAVARYERLRADLRIQGLYLQICLECLEGIEVEVPPNSPSPKPAEWRQKKVLELPRRLKLYQVANNA
ncbi:hypothetical protein V7S43_014245 [Phytophthora oleae]|uniref:Reverse transcriptase zinc-binding domain-containing protein n=1 Tax=Phytophthora oleae TaxID=2107226 RepID=A0ABD3F234_9STRA